ncbi:Hypothetical predicted protein [Mytilus galloprovincialis]|uniref:Uncharacterized protein n=1 Tax=Mytilus galloprovincialis TaxID=29158 RepID=A0A8B6G5G4_MYTGA|nr:Hypothetical predicted protein [Mytilus galloprovincialis]
MTNNLVFTGLHEIQEEDTEDVTQKFMLNELRITHRVELGNVHRFGHGALCLVGEEDRDRSSYDLSFTKILPEYYETHTV